MSFIHLETQSQRLIIIPSPMNNYIRMGVLAKEEVEFDHFMLGSVVFHRFCWRYELWSLIYVIIQWLFGVVRQFYIWGYWYLVVAICILWSLCIGLRLVWSMLVSSWEANISKLRYLFFYVSDKIGSYFFSMDFKVSSYLFTKLSIEHLIIFL